MCEVILGIVTEAWLCNKNHPDHFPKTSKCFENLVGMIFLCGSVVFGERFGQAVFSYSFSS